jgi:anti-sigma regulatory factor (Ser/Thr protein kinase)
MDAEVDDAASDDGRTADHSRAGSSCEVSARQDDRGDVWILAVEGVLSSWDAGAVRRLLGTHLLDRGRVVVDLARATVGSDGVAQMFPTALAEEGGWPLARLVLARANPLTAGVLQAARVHLTVPLAGTLDEARALLDVRPPQVARSHSLPGNRTATALARAAVASACEDWELCDGLYEAAATVATELVSNAVEHVGTRSTLRLALDRQCLQIAVHDRRPVTEGRPRIAVNGDRGYGLLMVQGLSRGWGVTPCADGKTVWALFDADRDPLA